MNLRRIRNNAFNQSLALMQSRLTVINSVFIWLTLGLHGAVRDYLIAGAYFIWGLWLLFFVVPVLTIRPLRLALPFLDLVVTVYMIGRTGGLASPLCQFLFFPVLVAMVRSRYAGIIVWSGVEALLLAAAAYCSGTWEPLQWLVKVSYLFLFGMLGGFLIDRTYLVTAEGSKRFANQIIDLKRLTTDLNQVSISADLDQIFAQTLQIISRHSFAPKLAVMVFDEKGNLLVVKAEGWTDDEIKGYNHDPLSRYSLLLAPTLVFRKPLLCPDIGKHAELTRPFANSDARSLFLFPLVVRNEIAGVVGLADYGPKTIGEADKDIVTGIVNQAGIAIQNAICLDEEKKRADTDGLTGLYNRRYFNEKLEKLFQAGQSPLSLIMMDIDNFKKYNDTFGHPAGDLLLKKVARVVQDVISGQGIAARYGGEEFVVILPWDASPSARKLAETIRLAVANLPELQCPVTVSVGVGTAPDQAGDAAALIEFADRSLYFAKTTGKNRVCSGFATED